MPGNNLGDSDKDLPQGPQEENIEEAPKPQIEEIKFGEALAKNLEANVLVYDSLQGLSEEQKLELALEYIDYGMGSLVANNLAEFSTESRKIISDRLLEVFRQ